MREIKITETYLRLQQDQFTKEFHCELFYEDMSGTGSVVMGSSKEDFADAYLIALRNIHDPI